MTAPVRLTRLRSARHCLVKNSRRESTFISSVEVVGFCFCEYLPATMDDVGSSDDMTDVGEYDEDDTMDDGEYKDGAL